MALKLAYLNKRKPKVKPERWKPDYKKEAYLVWKENVKSPNPIKLNEEEFRAKYEFYLRREYDDVLI